MSFLSQILKDTFTAFFIQGRLAGRNAWSVTGTALVAALLVPSSVDAQINITATDPQVKITKVSGKMEGGQWVETVEVENTGTTNVSQWFVTSQPYNGDKWQYGKDPVTDVPNSGANVADRQINGLDLGAGKKTTITFKYKKPFANFYVDVYSALPLTPVNRSDGIIGGYSPRIVQPRQTSYTNEFLFPFPNALAVAQLGQTTFNLQPTGLQVPTGWTLEDLGPSSFSLHAGESESIHATFLVPAGGARGEQAFADFAITPDIPGVTTVYRSSLGVNVVPEPFSVVFILAGLVVAGLARCERGSRLIIRPT
ncbi:MAG: hypothetical protein C5B46_05050 [Proteobacteria bacterium]|nr:MAG: hypothetical protein C5B46_05050 [Pseudomonadota bacterium]